MLATVQYRFQTPVPLVRPTFREIHLAVAAYYKLTPEDLMSPSRCQRIVRPRQMALYLSRTMTGMSFPRIARYYKRHHTTVMFSVDEVAQRVKTDRATWVAHHRLKRRIKGIARRRHACCSEELAA
ncbi:helix-turn-helix domain-containing protein [Sphingomonas sp.]|uniref:helix-turn-helix domain-containing protein n=1 Tax=Sphingomonas sp. TaxID=28214 RepID=UPI003F6F4B87